MNEKEIIYCPFCAMPHHIEVIFDKDSQSYAGQCHECLACGPVASSEEEAIRKYKWRAHDPEWAFKKGWEIASRFNSSIGQTDTKKTQALAAEIGKQILDEKPTPSIYS